MRGFPPRTTILPILCLIFYDILSILSGRGLVVPPVAAADEVSLILTVEYAVEYTTAKNDKTCSEYYAQKFLGNFVIGYPELQTNCRKNCPSQDIEVHIARTLTYYQQKNQELLCFDNMTAVTYLYNDETCMKELDTTTTTSTTTTTIPTTSSPINPVTTSLPTTAIPGTPPSTTTEQPKTPSAYNTPTTATSTQEISTATGDEYYTTIDEEVVTTQEQKPSITTPCPNNGNNCRDSRTMIPEEPMTNSMPTKKTTSMTRTPRPTPAPTAPTPAIPAPTTATPEQTTVTPAPTTATPEQTTATPEQTTATPEQTTATPAPTTATPAPTTATPEQTTATPEQTTSSPIPAKTTTEQINKPKCKGKGKGNNCQTNVAAVGSSGLDVIASFSRNISENISINGNITYEGGIVKSNKRKRRSAGSGSLSSAAADAVDDAMEKFVIRFTGEIHVNGTSGYSSIACCEQELNDTVFNSINALPAIRKLDGNGTCGPANITSAGVQKTNSSYYCSNNGYTYDQRQKKCVTKPPGGIPSPPCPTPNSGCDQPCVAEVICKVGSTMFCRRANECYHNLSNRMVSNVCFEELKKITTSGDIPCDIFTTPSTDTTTPEATTVAPMPPKVAHFDLKIKGKESLKIPLKEGEERNISFTVFTNSINPSVCSHESSPCTNLSVDLMFSYQSTPKIYCRRTNQPIQQLVVAAWYIDGQPKKLNATCKMKIEAHLNEIIIVTIRAVQDFKYDGIQKQKISFTLRLDANNERDMEEKDSVIISVNDVDLEKEATCSTINDPHITTFDKLKYDVFYQGEFIYYKNDVSRTQVNMIFQNCSQEVQASCNCGVGIRADDDIFVVQKCAQKNPQAFVPVETKLKISGNLTRGMRVMPRLDGFEYLIFLPEGTHVKVLFENELINVWIYASLSDFQNVKGLCGDYDGSCNNDIQSADSSSPTTINYNCTGNYNPSQYQTESKSWRVDIGGKDSLFGKYNGPCVFPPRPLYCMCDEEGNEICDEDAHFNVCDQEDRSACIDGKCDQFNENVQSSCTLTSRRKKRQTNNNNVIDANNNFDIDVDYKPPQKFNWTNDWDLSKARYQCESFLYNASEAKRCRPLVDFEPYIQSCVKDIEITGGENWKHSTKEAMVQECLLKLNNDPNQTDLSVCPKECQNSGKCLSSGACQCTEKYVGSYCQMKKEDEPTVVYLDNDGQCDTTSMQCKNVIVYGRDFIESPKLKCRLYDVTYKCNNVQGIEGSCNSTSLIVNNEKYEDIKGRFLSFNTVLCRLERLRSCSISVSNDGINYGVGKLFVPYNSHCQFCTTENLNCKSTIDQLRNYCLYLHECHAKGKGHPENECSQCQANLDGTLTWSSLQTEECKGSRLPDWGVALVAAGAGALFGILFGFLLYMCCCKCSIFERKSSRESEFVMSMRDPDAEAVFPVVPNPNIYRDQNFARYGAADDLVDDVRPVTYPNHVQYRRRTSPADDEDYDNYF